jgi:phosphohistidine swiveling domain-containing protein
MSRSEKFSIFVEDHNIPPHPWIFLNETFKPSGFKEYSKNLFIDNLFYFEKDKTLWGPKKSQFIKAANFFENRIQQKNSFSKKIIKDHIISFRKIEDFIIRLLKQDFMSLSNLELYSWYKEFQALSIQCFKPGIIIQYLEMSDDKMSNRVRELLKVKLSKKLDFEKTFNLLITPYKQTYLFKEKLAILKTLIKFQQDKNKWKKFKNSNSFAEIPKEFSRELKKLSKKFGWMQFYYDGQAADYYYYYNLLKNYQGKPIFDLRKKQEEIRYLKKEQQAITENLDRELKKKIFLLREFAFLKEMRKEIQIYRLNWAMQNWWQEVARRLYTSATLTKYIMPAELETWLKKDKSISISKLNERYSACAVLLDKGKMKVYSGKKALDLKSLFIQEKINTKNTKVIKGVSAYPGKVKGRVKIVNSILDIDEFKESDILVSFSTNPSLISAMNKAAAIITNTGGITCHAAIVSRELKTPCIIGTKIATKVLKDGDLVEVDANKGEVRIIKRKKYE